jgi:NhaP-type Na+/H+ or K+/H+ antiporter
VLYVGWFGPRGLASIVFALLLLHDGPPAAETLVDVVSLTVGLSVLLHGATAAWAAGRYASWHTGAAAAHPDLREGPAEPAPRVGTGGISMQPSTDGTGLRVPR